MPKIRLLEISGTPLEMGRQHGRAYPEEIRLLAEERVELSRSKAWTGHELSRSEVLALGEACLPYHQAYAPELMAELQGISEVTGVSPVELIILNGFTDFIDTIYNVEALTMPVPAHPGADNCTAFIVSPQATAEGQGFYGQTWDMHATATPYVILLHGKPEGGLRFLTLTIIGCVGMIGLNEAGIAVGINNLVANDGQIGVTWPFVIRKILAQDNLDEALACLTGARLAGGHNYMLVDAHGRGYNVEAMASRYHVEEVGEESLVHTNHCLHPTNIQVERTRLPKSRASSETRLSRAESLLRSAGRLCADRKGRQGRSVRQGRQVTLADLFALTRDHTAINGICVHPEEPFFLESCSSAIMRPATREMWAVWGPACQNEYEHFIV